MNDVDDIMAKVNAMERRQFAEEQTVVSYPNPAMERRIAELERNDRQMKEALEGLRKYIEVIDGTIRTLFEIAKQNAMEKPDGN